MDQPEIVPQLDTQHERCEQHEQADVVSVQCVSGCFRAKNIVATTWTILTPQLLDSRFPEAAGNSRRDAPPLA